MINYKVKLLLFASLVLYIGCTNRPIVIGEIETYPGFFEDNESYLSYSIGDKNYNELYRGRTKLNKEGHFSFHFPAKYLTVNNSIMIDGSENIPPSFIGTDTIHIEPEIDRYDMGTIFAYDHIRLLLEDVDKYMEHDELIRWECDIPNIDYYRIDISKRIINFPIYQKVIDINQIDTNGINLSLFLYDPEKLANSETNILLFDKKELITGEYMIIVEAIRIKDDIEQIVGRSMGDQINISF